MLSGKFFLLLLVIQMFKKYLCNFLFGLRRSQLFPSVWFYVSRQKKHLLRLPCFCLSFNQRCLFTPLTGFTRTYPKSKRNMSRWSDKLSTVRTDCALNCMAKYVFSCCLPSIQQTKSESFNGASSLRLRWGLYNKKGRSVTKSTVQTQLEESKLELA